MRSLELILSVLALFSAAALFLPKFPALWKSKILPSSWAWLPWVKSFLKASAGSSGRC